MNLAQENRKSPINLLPKTGSSNRKQAPISDTVKLCRQASINSSSLSFKFIDLNCNSKQKLDQINYQIETNKDACDPETSKLRNNQTSQRVNCVIVDEQSRNKMGFGNRGLAVSAFVMIAIWMILCETSADKTASAAILKPQGLSSRELEKQIVDKILGEGYDKRIRPSGINNKTGQNDGAAIVRVNTLIRSISKIDDVTMEYSIQITLRQEWIDERLAFNKMASYKNYNINSITLTEQERLWKPDLFFRNEKEGHFHKIIMPNVLLRINGDGSVLYSIRISLVLACPMDLKYYPLDKQNCTIEMASYGYLDDDLKFLWKEKEPVQINKGMSLPRFALETFGTAFCTSRTATGAYSCLRVDLIFKREFSYYLIQIYIPCCMLVIVSWVSFWLDPNAIPARVSLGVTTLLTMATQISGINASLPPVSYIKAIDVWTGVCLTFVFGALLEFALVNYASRSDAHARMQQARRMEELKQRELEFHHRQQQQQLAAAAVARAAMAGAQQPPGAPGQPNYVQVIRLGRPDQSFSLPNGPAGAQNNISAPPKQSGGGARNSPSRGLPYVGVSMGDNSNNNSTTDSQKQHLLPGSDSHNPNAPAQSKAASAGRSSAQQGCELHHTVMIGAPSGGRPLAGSANAAKKKKVNFCRAWLNKFPSRSKRIDVISRIFFPKMFALFNLVYWTTYLFREDNIVRP